MENVTGIFTTFNESLSPNSTRSDVPNEGGVVTEISSMPEFTTEGTTAYYDYDSGEYDYGDEYVYPGYDFERDLYLYIWGIIVIAICLVNAVVISVLLRRKMRNATNIILAAIAVSDSLTGLVTLPTYIMVYQRYDSIDYGEHDTYSSDSTTTSFDVDEHDNGKYSDSTADTLQSNKSIHYKTTLSLNYDSYAYDSTAQESLDSYILTKSLCQGFMFSKYFLSKSFHTVSIVLTLFLAIQRYVSVAYPYKSQFMFSTQRTLVCCALIFLLSPLPHTYHLTTEKAKNGLCQWELQESSCGGTCIYLWVAFLLRHFLPCVTLVVLSVLFISHLRLGEESLRRMDSNSSQLSRRSAENRRISIIVMAIVVVFLIPEVPYSIFLLYNAIAKAATDGKDIKLKTNRIIQLLYEVALVFSFHANFYIYMLFNKRFRRILYRTIVKPVRRLVGDPRRLSITRTSTASHAGSTKKTPYTSSKTQHETKWLHTNDSEKSSGMETKTMHTFTPEKSQNGLELEPLDSKL